MTENNKSVTTFTTTRKYKDRLFRLIFQDKEELLELYNAVNDTNYDNPDDFVVNTLDNAIYMSMKNDLSFIIDDRMLLYEHQSTKNPNIPLRNLHYICNFLSAYTADKNLYGSNKVSITTPHFVVFYNGLDEQPERQILRLSQLYEIEEPEPDLELKVLVLNINPGYNTELMEKCKTLRDYTCYVDKVRTYAKRMEITEAVDRAMEECIADDILAKFLRQFKMEAKSMSIFEYDEEKHIKQIQAEADERAEKYRRQAEKAEEYRKQVEELEKSIRNWKKSIRN